MRRLLLSLIVLSYTVVATAAPAAVPVAPAGSLAAAGAHAHHAGAAPAPPMTSEPDSGHCGEHAPASEGAPCAPPAGDCCEDGATDCASCICVPLLAVAAGAIESNFVIPSWAPRASAPLALPSRAPPLLFRPPIA